MLIIPHDAPNMFVKFQRQIKFGLCFIAFRLKINVFSLHVFFLNKVVFTEFCLETLGNDVIKLVLPEFLIHQDRSTK